MKATTVTGEAELAAAPEAWSLRPEQFPYPWQSMTRSSHQPHRPNDPSTGLDNSSAKLGPPANATTPRAINQRNRTVCTHQLLLRDLCRLNELDDRLGQSVASDLQPAAFECIDA